MRARRFDPSLLIFSELCGTLANFAVKSCKNGLSASSKALDRNVREGSAKDAKKNKSSDCLDAQNLPESANGAYTKDLNLEDPKTARCAFAIEKFP
jgi:hypothetical protein